MNSKRTGLKIHRRQFLQTAATASCGLSLPALGQVIPPRPGTVRDKLWLFSNPTDADYDMLLKRSVMSPCEAAIYMGIPNIFMVQQYPGKGGGPGYKPFEPPFEQYTIPLTMLKRVAWSLVGASGVTKDWERKQVLSMAHKTPNIVGVYLDDFFREEPGRELASLTLEQLRDIQRQIKGPDKKMDMYVTFYARQLSLPIAEYLKLIDVITLWMWNPEELANVDSYLNKLDQMVPHCRKMLGVYTTALQENKTPPWVGMPVPLMQKQCEAALAWLRSGRIEGIIVYGGTTFDLGFEAVDWTREWIKKVGPMKL
ncbi:MAG: hypothetical protein ABSH52_29770 [Terriglobia bacterium]|jgi:hypothetical protein